MSFNDIFSFDDKIPEWEGSYIDYHGLEKLVKAVGEKNEDGEQGDLTVLFSELDRNMEKVDSFYTKEFGETRRRLELLRATYTKVLDAVASLNRDEVEEFVAALDELWRNFDRLRRFGKANRHGFVEITTRLDGKIAGSTLQQNYISTMIDPKSFATASNISSLLTEIELWLYTLRGSRNADTFRIADHALLNIPSALRERVEQAIGNDDVDNLKARLEEGILKGSKPSAQCMMLNLLQWSIRRRSKKSVDYLLANIASLDEPSHLSGRNPVHQLVIYIGRTRVDSMQKSQSKAASSSPTGQIQESDLPGKEDELVQMLRYLLEKLRPPQREALTARDALGRLPLHYAAQYGITDVCQVIIKAMQVWDQLKPEVGIHSPEWQDKEGHTPLHLGFIGGHALTTEFLLQEKAWKGIRGHKPNGRSAVSNSGEVLALATKSNFSRIVRILMDDGVDVNCPDERGETALHLAARFGHDECARALLQGTGKQKVDLELAEKSHAWTALHVAAIDGHFSVAQLLVDAGADVDKLDSSGWTAREHAALRGHLPIARWLADRSHSVEDTAESKQDSSRTSSASLEQKWSGESLRPAESVKGLDLAYPKDQNESKVLVSLGSMDMRKSIEAVQLERVPLGRTHPNKLDTALSIVVSAIAAEGKPVTFDLPVQDNISTEPICFTATDATQVKLVFDIVVLNHDGKRKSTIGRAVALLSSVKPGLGAKRMNLQGDVCVPILGTRLDVIGAVNFNYLIIMPFSHPNMQATPTQTHWKTASSTMLIGHRGLGKNTTSNKSLQLGENTVPSFIAATNLGAQYVEFDVQMTKDHVPVIYHDFLVSETGTDIPVHTLTLEQFLHLNPPLSRGGTGSERQTKEAGGNAPGTRQRSSSTSSPIVRQHVQSSMEERMKHTRDFKEKGFKANSPGHFIQAPFATLEDLLRQLPASISFNIEMKYPMLHESEDHGMDTYAVELNAFCDAVLTKVYDLAGGRSVVFSSFHPDICLCLRFKQPSMPVLFLTDSGASPVGDVRASSLQEAIRFATRWDLLGIVSHAEPLVNSPRLIRAVKQNGLVCVSYGLLNNDPAMVKVDQGIDAVIVDSVLTIHKALTGDRGADEQDGVAVEKGL